MTYSKSKIPVELHEAVFQRSGSGAGTRQIAKWLEEEHGVKVSHESVAALLRKESRGRADEAKAIARTKLTRSVTTDLDRLELYARKAMRIARSVEGEPELWVKVAEQVRKFTVEKLNRSGVDTPDDTLSDLAAAERRVASRIALLVAEEEGDMGEPDETGEGGS